MKMGKLLALALLVASMSCWAGDFGTSDKVSMTGGVCVDDPFLIWQKTTTASGETDHTSYMFSDECKALGTDKSVFDQPPTAFVCHAGGKSPLAGATYQKIRNTIIKSKDELRVDTRVYIYQCTKSCKHAPKKIMYTVEDCG